jgi:hypothetical protein
VCGAKRASDLVYLNGFRVVERTGRDSVVKGFRGELAYRERGAGQGKEPTCAWQRDFIAGTDGDDTGHEQLKGCVKALCSERKQGCLWQRTDGLTQACYGYLNIERAFPRAALLWGRSIHVPRSPVESERS